MTEKIDDMTMDAGTFLASPSSPRAFLAIHIESDDRSRIIELPLETDVSFGRSRGATVVVDHEKISRMHARVRRRADSIEIEDLGSRNGTRVNGTRIEGTHTLASGDEISIGPILAIVGVTSGLRRRSRVADAATVEQRLVAEVDRSVRYRRSLAVALVRIANDDVVDAMARVLRPMDMLGEDAGDDYLVLLPELDRAAASSTLHRLIDIARTVGAAVKTALVMAPEEGVTSETLIARLRAELRGAPAPTAEVSRTSEPVVLDPTMKRVFTLAERIADSAMAVLILGESGVGKTLVAEAIHEKSGRRGKPLVRLGCAAVPEAILEADLFTAFESATGSTLFLDEIGDMPLALQAKLLRVLERKSVTRGASEIPVEVRLIASSQLDLEAEVRAGRFRQDLLSRIGGFAIVVPSLRDRPDEILPLAEHFIQLASTDRAPPAISPDARDALTGYAWPGNVRELRTAIERALVLCTDTLTTADLPERLHDADQRVRPITSMSDVRGQLAEVERAALVNALDAEGGNQTRAARRLGLSRRALIYKMEKYGLKPLPGTKPGG
jgi:two-component system, NtrC family, response regulator AtoC